MYVITNRNLSNAKTLRAFGKTPNPKGPNELRIVRVKRWRRSWQVEKMPDELSRAQVNALNRDYKLELDASKPWHGSLMMACELFEKARQENKSILLFVHGYNNDVEDVLRAAEEIEEMHNVIVVPFTWPANGGGAVSGTASYLSDKADARASSGALNRVIGKFQQFHLLMTEAQRKRNLELAIKKHPDNHSAANSYFTRLTEKTCNTRISLLCHSMGNYVFKHTFATSQNATSKLVFDNICLVAADANNDDHEHWVSQLDVRKRVYVVINENDFALRASRIKPGDEQKARLGHYTRKLVCANTHYLDLTEASEVGSDHTYFKGDTPARNPSIARLFRDMFSGLAVEHGLVYLPENNTYRMP